MKTFGLILSFLIISYTTVAQDKTGVDITVTIENFLSNKGKALTGLHSVKTFMKGQGIQNVQSTIKEGVVTLVFKNVAPGEYAIMAMHDENDNKQMDFEANGMPKESYGVSGNANSFGPPTFNDSKFTVKNENLKIKIRF